MQEAALLMFIALFLGILAAGGYYIEKQEKAEQYAQQKKEKANRSNADWQETYKLAYRLEYQKILREEK